MAVLLELEVVVKVLQFETYKNVSSMILLTMFRGSSFNMNYTNGLDLFDSGVFIFAAFLLLYAFLKVKSQRKKK